MEIKARRDRGKAEVEEGGAGCHGDRPIGRGWRRDWEGDMDCGDGELGFRWYIWEMQN
jgi:hypothetical protein